MSAGEVFPRNNEPEAMDGALMPWRIVQLAVLKGEFRVSWRYRDDRLRRRCYRLRKQGWLRQVRTPAGEDVFVPGKLCATPPPAREEPAGEAGERGRE